MSLPALPLSPALPDFQVTCVCVWSSIRVPGAQQGEMEEVWGSGSLQGEAGVLRPQGPGFRSASVSIW